MKKQKSRLLLHTCCADCAVKYIHSLDKDFEITLYFDNNNIHPRSEYFARLEAVKQIAEQESIPIIISDWSPKLWFKDIGFQEKNDNNERCRLCWIHRLKNTVEYAKTHKFDYFSTTLLSSHYQDKNTIISIAKKLEKDKIKLFAPEQFKETKTKGFYKQNYCGCVFSLKDRYFEKYSQ